MNRRKFLPDFSCQFIGQDLEIKPPFIEADHSIMIRINPREKVFEFGLGNHEACSPKRRLQLIFVQLSIVIPVYTLEKFPKLFLGFFYKGTKLWGTESDKSPGAYRYTQTRTRILYPSISVGINHLENIMK